MFGEDDLLENNKRSYTVVCESMLGELLMMKKQ